MRSVTVVFPASIWATMPIFRMSAAAEDAGDACVAKPRHVDETRARCASRNSIFEALHKRECKNGDGCKEEQDARAHSTSGTRKNSNTVLLYCISSTVLSEKIGNAAGMYSVLHYVSISQFYVPYIMSSLHYVCCCLTGTQTADAHEPHMLP
jgi:hypothetical protein